MVTFDIESQFYFDTSDRDAGRFYFKLVALHEIGNLFVGGDFHVLYAEDSNSVMVTTYFCREKNTLSTCDAATIGDVYTFSSTIQNSFNDGSDYVNIYNSQNSKTVKSAPYNHDEFKSTWPWDMEAENQNFTENSKTYYMQFQTWSGYDYDDEYDERQDIPMEDGNFTANFHKTFNIDFTNKYGTSGTGGVINVISSQVNSPTSNYQVTEYNTISASAVNQSIDGVNYTFSHWTKDGGQTIPAAELTSGSPPFKPVDHTTYECNLSGTPFWTNRNLHTNSTPGAYITVYWNEHPCSDVTYKIYRKIRHNGVMGSEVLRATISHGTTQWTDNIQIADEQTTDLVLYDVRAYHTPSSTYSDVNFEVTVYTWTEQNIQTTDENQYQTAEADENALALEATTPTETTLGNYPNPFNPNTVISYQIAVESKVVLKVYDMLGKEVATLVNDTKPAGSYNISFNGANLPSGVYIYTLQTNSQAITKKMLLMNKATRFNRNPVSLIKSRSRIS